MYSTRVNKRPADRDVSMQAHSVPHGPMPPFMNSLAAWKPTKIRKRKEGETKERA